MDADTASMFPDLNARKPAEAAVMKAARAYIVIRDERAEFLTDAKQREDEAHEALLEACEKAEVTKFTLDGRQIDIELKKKAKVKAAKIDEENADDAQD